MQRAHHCYSREGDAVHGAERHGGRSESERGRERGTAGCRLQAEAVVIAVGTRRRGAAGVGSTRDEWRQVRRVRDAF